MRETLEEQIRRLAKNECNEHINAFATNLVALLDARDKIIAEQRAVIAELSEEPITEFETLRQAHDAQNAVLARIQAELDALRAERDEWKLRVTMAQDDDKSFYEPQLDAARVECEKLRAERDAAISQISFLNKVIERLQAPRQ